MLLASDSFSKVSDFLYWICKKSRNLLFNLFFQSSGSFFEKYPVSYIKERPKGWSLPVPFSEFLEKTSSRAIWVASLNSFTGSDSS